MGHPQVVFMHCFDLCLRFLETNLEFLQCLSLFEVRSQASETSHSRRFIPSLHLTRFLRPQVAKLGDVPLSLHVEHAVSVRRGDRALKGCFLLRCSPKGASGNTCCHLFLGIRTELLRTQNDRCVKIFDCSCMHSMMYFKYYKS